MKAYDLVDVRLPVEVGGRRFEVRRLRLCDVLRILVRFEEQYLALTTAEQPDPAAVILKLDRDDTADLFAFCLDPYDPLHLRKTLDLKKSAEVAAMIAAVNDLARIWGSLKLGRAKPPDEPGKVEPIAPRSNVPPLLRVVDRLAQRYRCEPQAVMLWSYEAFLTLADVADEDFELDAAAAMNASGLDPDMFDDSEIPVEKIRDLNKDVH